MNAQAVSWSKDISCIIYDNCTGCHNDNGIAPFSLMTYEDASERAALIAHVTKNRIMPPWPPNPHINDFTDERLLTQDEIDAIQHWADFGAPSGDLSIAPDPPTYESTELIADPDMVVELPEYTSKANNGDEYRCFVIPSGLLKPNFVQGLEVVPQNRKIVHHVLVFQDTTEVPRNLDQADPAPGYLCFGGIGSNSAQLIGGWVPGQQASYFADGMGLSLPAKTDIVVQLHYPQGSQGQSDQTKINFVLSEESSLREIRITPFLNHLTNISEPLFIPANSVKSFKEQFYMPVRITVLGAAPHMHLIGKSIKSYAVTPNEDTLHFIDIPQWDFEWQGFYNFKKPAIIPPGSTLYAEATYDNTSNNHHNPNFPPKDVFVGEATTDEMMLVFLPWLFYNAGDEDMEFADNPREGSPDCGQFTVPTAEIGFQHVKLELYPNPVRRNGRLIVSVNLSQFRSESLQYRFLSVDGQIQYTGQIQSEGDNLVTIPGHLAQGLYFIHFIDDKHQLVASEKIIMLE